MKPPKRRPKRSTPAAAPSGVVRVGFSSGALAFFNKLPAKVRDGLRRKLRDFGMNPAIGKPLIGDLQRYRRVTYGRVRSIAEAVVTNALGAITVYVLHIGLRKEGSADDAYEAAAIEALKRRDPEVFTLIETEVHQALERQQPPYDNEEA